MTAIHLLSSDRRLTNTQWHLESLLWNMPSLQTQGTSWNAQAILNLCETGWLALVPYYNVLGKSVRDTMQAIAEKYQLLKLHRITRMRIEYILAMKQWTSLETITDVFSHPQALLQTTKERQEIIPYAQSQHAKSTADWLEIILNGKNEGKNAAAITTPFQILPWENEKLSIINNFGPDNNHTYFALLWLRDLEIEIPELINSQNHTIMSEDAIKFGVLTIPNYPWSLCDALGKISTHDINIMSIMSFPQSDNTVIFTIAYSNEQLTRNNFSIKKNKAKPVINQIQSKNNQDFSAIIHIPTNTPGSLYYTLLLLKDIIDLQEISSIGTGMDTVDFEIKFSLRSGTGDDIENKINTIFQDASVEPILITRPTKEEIGKILHNLH